MSKDILYYAKLGEKEEVQQSPYRFATKAQKH
jgi:hypothetical protein